MARSAFLWFFTESWGSKQGIRRSPKSCTRKEHESATNPIAKRGQGAIAPCRVKGQRPLWGLGQRPNCSAGDQYAKRAQQRCRQRSVPASNFALPQKRPQAAFPNAPHIVAPNGRDRLAVLPDIAVLSRKQGFRLCGGDEGAVKTAEVCDRPLDPFGSHPCFLNCVETIHRYCTFIFPNHGINQPQ